MPRPTPPPSFADWELTRQGLHLDPLLQTISDLLDDQHAIIEAIGRDLRRGLKQPETGRNGLAASQVLRAPQRGGHKSPKRAAFEKSPAFKQGQRFRAGVEGRISVLLRGRGMKRCLAEGRERFQVLIGAAILANNLMRIAALLAKPARRNDAPPEPLSTAPIAPALWRALAAAHSIIADARESPKKHQSNGRLTVPDAPFGSAPLLPLDATVKFNG